MTEMIEVKTDDLIGPDLDFAVAQAIGEQVEFYCGCVCLMTAWDEHGDRPNYQPSIDWAQGGPLLELKNWSLPYRATARHHLGKYEACSPGGLPHNGDTPLIAACRAIVAATFGTTVSVPKELLK